MIRKNYFSSVVLLVLTVFLTNAHSAWDVSPAETSYQYGPGESFTVEVELSGSGSDIDALGFDFNYPNNLLTFDNVDFSGTLMDVWNFKQSSELSPGLLKIGGFTTTGIITGGTQGTIVKINFTVKQSATGSGQFMITNVTDDLTGATTSAATFNTGGAPTDGWDISPAESQYQYSPGQAFTVDVELSGDGDDIDALGFDFNYPNSLLTFDNVDFSGTLMEPWDFKQSSEPSPGLLKIGGFTTTGIITGPTQDTLVKINFTVKQGANGNGMFTIDQLTDDVSDATAGSATFSTNTGGGYDVSGTIQYFQNQKAVPSADVSLNGNFTITDNSGQFSFSQIPGGNYSLKPAKTGDVGNSVSPFDASMVLRFAVGLISLTPYQQIAADVSGNGSISPFDASYILRYSVGLISSFPVGADWGFVPNSFVIDENNWNEAPDSIDYSPLNSNQTGQDFTGIVYGDVTGNWLNASLTASTNGAEVIVKNFENLQNSLIKYPIEFQIDEEAFSGSFTLNYSSNDYEFVSCSNPPTGGLIAAASSSDGQVKIAFASENSLSNQKLTFNLLLKKIKSGQTHLPDVELTDVFIDDKSVLTTAVNQFQQNELPADFNLHQNHPNPFNPETNIRFTIPKSCFVTMAVYNQLGQRVKTLVNGIKSPGTHEVTWNGLDENDQPVVSGVYIYKMNTNNFTASKKLILIR